MMEKKLKALIQKWLIGGLIELRPLPIATTDSTVTYEIVSVKPSKDVGRLDKNGRVVNA